MLVILIYNQTVATINSFYVNRTSCFIGMIIYANKGDITSQFYSDTDNSFTYIAEGTSEGTLIISKRDETLTVLFPTSGKIIYIK